MSLDNLVQSVREQIKSRFYQSNQAGMWQEVDRNLHAALQEVFARMDLVTREEFDVQKEVLARTRAQLDALEARVAELERRLAAGEG